LLIVVSTDVEMKGHNRTGIGRKSTTKYVREEGLVWNINKQSLNCVYAKYYYQNNRKTIDKLLYGKQSEGK